MGPIYDFQTLLKKSKKDRTTEEQEWLNTEMLNRTGGKAMGLSQAGGVFGNIMQATSAMPGQEPNVGQSAMGGALSGFSSGMALGPLGALLGAGIGGLTGFMSGSNNLEQHLLQLNEEQNANMASKTIQPTTYKPGGIVGQEGVQTEVGEVILLADILELVNSAAKEEHKDMEGSLITDFFPKGSVVFSNQRIFDPETLEHKVLGYGPGHYTENKTYAPEQITVGHKFGDEKVTYAEAAKKLKNSISVTDGKKKDIFDDITDAENKVTRMMYLQELINSQEGLAKAIEEESVVPQFAGGGTVGSYSSNISDILKKKLAEINAQKPSDPYKDGTQAGVGVGADYYKDVLKKLEELSTLNQSERDRGKSDLSDLSKKMRGSVMTQAGMSSLFTGLQNPIDRPVVQGNTFIEDAYQQIPMSMIESQVSPIRGSVNSMAQMLLSSGVDPSRVPSMLASSQGRALDAEGQMRSRFIDDRMAMDRGKYQALRNNLTTNQSNIVNAENSTNEGYNEKFGQFGSILAQMMGQNRELTAGNVEASRNLDKSFFANDISLFQTGADIAGQRMEFDDNMRRVNERLESLRLEREKNNSAIDSRTSPLGSTSSNTGGFQSPLLNRGQNNTPLDISGYGIDTDNIRLPMNVMSELFNMPGFTPLNINNQFPNFTPQPVAPQPVVPPKKKVINSNQPWG